MTKAACETTIDVLRTLKEEAVNCGCEVVGLVIEGYGKEVVVSVEELYARTNLHNQEEWNILLDNVTLLARISYECKFKGYRVTNYDFTKIVIRK